MRQLIGTLLDNAIRHAHGERIFEPFVRLASSSASAGLGLPIARWLAEAHGGSLVLASTGADGSCFAVTLPAR